MATVKRTSGNLIIQTPVKTGVNSNITLDTDFVIITGNLNVRGNTTVINSNIQTISDNILTLNSGETGNGVSTLGTTSGIEIDRGSAAGGNVQLIWNESTSTWQISGVAAGSPGDGSLFLDIATSIGGTALTAVVQDTNPYLGANLNVNGFALYANVGSNVLIGSNIQINSAMVSNISTTLYTTIPEAGQSGLYVTNQVSVDEELITKRRAFGFSLLL
jgi:hypothetical protein